MIPVQELSDGEIVKLNSDKFVFKLSSYKGNPILKPQDFGLVWEENGKHRTGAIFNGGAELYNNKIILTPRCHKRYNRVKSFDSQSGTDRYCLDNYLSEIWILESEDGVHFNRFNNLVIRGDGVEHRDFIYGIEDIRITRYSDFYWLMGCGKLKPPFKGGNADRIAIYSTKDFSNIKYHGMVSYFDTRNAVLFSDGMDNELYLLLVFYPNIHLAKIRADQLLNPTGYESEWKSIYRHRNSNLLIKAGEYLHEGEKIGAGPPPIKTERGWLLIYHSVGELSPDICKLYGVSGKIKRGYSVCVALLDLDARCKVIARTNTPVYIPSAPYELYGDAEYPVDIPAVVFPVGAIVIDNKLLLYCGAGDKYTILLSCDINKLVNYLIEYCSVRT